MSCLLFVALASPEFAVYQRDDAIPVGPLLRLDTDWSVQLGGQNPVTVAGVDLVELRRTDLPVPPTPGGPRLLMANGDVLAGDLLGGDDLSVRFRCTLAPESDGWRIPLSRIDGIRVSDVDGLVAGHEGWKDWESGDRAKDAVLLRNGDLLVGTLAEFTDPITTIKFRGADGADLSPLWDRIAAVGFSTALMRKDEPKGVYARLVYADGTRLAVRAVTVADGRLTVTTQFRQSVNTPTDRLVSLRTINGPAVYLSSLTPTVRQTAYFGTPWPWRAGRSLTGEPIRLITESGAAATFDDGLGVAPGTSLGFSWEGEFRRVECWVGLQPHPDPTRRLGGAIVKIQGGTKENPLQIGAGEPGQLFRQDLGGAAGVSLTAEFDDGGPVLSAVNWASARLIR